MPTVIDSLIIKLGLDTKGLSQGQTQAGTALAVIKNNAEKTGVALKATGNAARTTATAMSSQGNIAGEYFAKIKNQALGLLAVLIGGKGIESIVRSTVTSLADLGRASQNIGVSVPELAAFRNTIEANGGSAEAAAASFQHLADEMATLKATGQSAILPVLNMIGGQRGETAMQTYMRFVEFAAAHKNDAGLIRLVGHRLGLDEGSINEAMRGTAQVVKDMADATKRGVPTPEMAARAAALQRAWFGLSQAAINLVNVLVDRFTPALTGILDAITAFLTGHGDLVTTIALVLGLASAFKALFLVVRIAGFVTGLTSLTGALGGLAGVNFAAITGGLTGFVGVLLRLLAGPLGGFLLGMMPKSTQTPEDDRAPYGGKSLHERFPDRVVPKNIPTGRVNQANAKELHDYFIGKGWTEAQVAGILANYQGESALNAAAVGDRGASAGLAQWRGSRRAEFARQYGHDVSLGTPREQAEFTHWELTHTEKAAGDALRGARTAGEAASIVSKRYERPQDVEMNAKLRAQYGEAWVRQFAVSPGVRAAQDNAAGIIRNVTALQQQPPSQAPVRVAQNDNAGGGGQDIAINGPIVIHTQATDAKGIARSLRGELAGRRIAGQANTGLS